MGYPLPNDDIGATGNNYSCYLNINKIRNNEEIVVT